MKACSSFVTSSPRCVVACGLKAVSKLTKSEKEKGDITREMEEIQKNYQLILQKSILNKTGKSK